MKNNQHSEEFNHAWMTLFLATRKKNYELMKRLINRIKGEFRQMEATETPKIENESTAGKGWLAGSERTIKFGNLLSILFSEIRYLRKSRFPAGQSVTLVISDESRTGLITSSQELVSLTKPLGQSVLPEEMQNAIDDCVSLLHFTPNLQPLRPSHPVDVCYYGYLSIFLLPIVHPISYLRCFIALLARAKVRHLLDKTYLITLALTAGFDCLLQRAKPTRCVMLTSNSFAIEILRWRFALSQYSSRLFEVLHGVPTEEIAEYFCEVADRVDSATIEKLKFIPPVPDLDLSNYPAGTIEKQCVV
ncbi:hypothetical protein OAK90_00675, partial [bacterium]|nr:hypothetical protein [bacterium]